MSKRGGGSLSIGSEDLTDNTRSDEDMRAQLEGDIDVYFYSLHLRTVFDTHI